MLSDKRNLIMAIDTTLISSLFNIALPGDMPFLPTAAAPMLASWFYQSSPLLSLYSIPFSFTM